MERVCCALEDESCVWAEVAVSMGWRGVVLVLEARLCRREVEELEAKSWEREGWRGGWGGGAWDIGPEVFMVSARWLLPALTVNQKKASKQVSKKASLFLCSSSIPPS